MVSAEKERQKEERGVGKMKNRPKRGTGLRPASYRACSVTSSLCFGTEMSFSRWKSSRSSASTRLFSFGSVRGFPQRTGNPQEAEDDAKKN